MDFDLLGKIFTAVLTITTVAASAGVALMLGSLKTLRESNADLRDRVRDLESERVEDREKLVASNAVAEQLASEKQWLTTMVQGRVDWTAISDQLEEHHRQALAWWKELGGTLQSILKALEGKKP